MARLLFALSLFFWLFPVAGLSLGGSFPGRFAAPSAGLSGDPAGAGCNGSASAAVIRMFYRRSRSMLACMIVFFVHGITVSGVVLSVAAVCFALAFIFWKLTG